MDIKTIRRKRARLHRPKMIGTSRHRGVFWNQFTQKWVAQIRVDGRMIVLGQYDNEDDAGERWNTAAIEFLDARPEQLNRFD